ncbi:TlpA family protein disulfide reductase [Natronolimnohabitans innermongolicus]|uniref:Alkyl hydroperoxide reductase/ thiol specific antioxidant/ Mal allergen n=1 Tax=Natronolimnohabitans innermongolicus JCM 12255 TaxID=1227499 RepID=L9XJ58_9EURY|nr:hypothetical protein [Natronolimnohabitans innermongolicus]ELY61627.1 alkyl hydroperoxide reductase/ thiol specific antioxidant/ Mal allergen [Natronolimnohabitans innermongolicus JCM 12255]
MKRREIVAGAGSLGILAGGVGLFRNGPPSFLTDEPESETDDDDGGPPTAQLIDADGSSAGTVSVPEAGTVTVAMFFVPACGNCQSQVSRLTAAREDLVDEYGDAVRVLALTYLSPDSLSDSELREWWSTHGGNGGVGYDDGVAGTYGAAGYPITLVIGPDGEEHWRDVAILEPSQIVREVEPVLEEAGLDDVDEEVDDDDDGGATEGEDTGADERENADENATAGAETETETGADADTNDSSA